jgi:hypothetical protein
LISARENKPCHLWYYSPAGLLGRLIRYTLIPQALSLKIPVRPHHASFRQHGRNAADAEFHAFLYDDFHFPALGSA